MEKRVAQRLARHLIAMGHSVRVKRHKSRIGTSVYSVEWTHDTPQPEP